MTITTTTDDTDPAVEDTYTPRRAVSPDVQFWNDMLGSLHAPARRALTEDNR
ncbi:hypothetical protein GCM10009785_19850 [Brooklawnia cerclae]|uniref:Uncharacterized protein n=1 Tax=Brooklawnia cerclae TaxID=349934 RepID=A0ABX0SFY7_9ACTN|nr:hypothetical protein [Brooklawnia cerclae]NIH57274.1 hypothetical protein [Brooklawnia cerclae]